MQKIDNFIKSSILLSVLLTFSCTDKNTDDRVAMKSFMASTEAWDVVDDDSVTRSAIKVTSEKTTLIADDGAIYDLTMDVGTGIDGMKSDSSTVFATTRGTMKTNFSTNETFKISGFVTGDGYSDEPRMNNLTATFNATTATRSGKTWRTFTIPGTHYWPSPYQVISLYGVWPTTYSIDTSLKSITGFTVADKADDQEDLVVGSTDALNRQLDAGAPIEMSFKHALTAIQFNSGTGLPLMTIDEIRFVGVSGSGRYSLGDGKWLANEESKEFYVVPTVTSVGGNSGNDNKILNPNSKVFLMMPQTLPDDAKLIITAHTTTGTTNVTRTLTADLSGMVWQPGTTVTYTLGKKKASGNHFYATNYANNDNYYYRDAYSYNDWNWTVDITSRALDTSTNPITWTPLPWKAVAHTTSDPKGNPNASHWKAIGSDNKITWYGHSNTSTYGGTTTTTATITSISGSGGNGGSGNQFIFTLSKPNQIYIRGQRHTDALAMAANTHEGTIDLSDGKKNTANCYIINGPGKYKFPLIYGNARKGNKDNTAAYSGLGLKDGIGREITSPTITVPSGAKARLLWMDNVNWAAKNAGIAWSDVALSDDYITFEVKTYKHTSGNTSDEILEPCNAVIALVDNSNKIIWAWHIWINRKDLSQDNNQNMGQYYYWYSYDAPARYCWVLFKQYTDTPGGTENSDAPTFILRLRHNSSWDYSETTKCCLRYRWGMPFPEPYLQRNGSVFVKAYNKDGNEYRNANANNYLTDLGYDYSGFATNNSNWNTNAKTVFDPCPVGYRVPDASYFSGLTLNSSVNYAAGWTFTNGVYLLSPFTGNAYYFSRTNSGNNCTGLAFEGGDAAKLVKNATIPKTTYGMIRPVSE